MKATPALLAFLATACGNVKDNAEVDASTDAADSLTPATAAITPDPIAGGPVQCTITAPASGTGPITNTVTWTLDGVAFGDTTTTTVTNDTIPGRVTHTGHVFACTVVSSDGTSTVASIARSATVEGRFAFVIDQSLSPQTLDKIDLDTFELTVVGPLGTTFSFGDLAFDTANHKLFMADGLTTNALFEVNTTTGAATLIGAHANAAKVRAIGYDPVADKLFAVAGDGTGLFTLNRATGAATLVGGTTALDGLAFDTKRARMIGIDANLNGGTLSVIDTATGGATNPLPAGVINNNGLTYDPFIDRFWAVTTNSELLQYDPNTGFARTTPKTYPGLKFTAIAFALPQ